MGKAPKANSKDKPKGRSIDLRDDPNHWLALGEFIEEFAGVEAVILHLLIHYAGIPHDKGRAIFSGTRARTAIDFINRLNEVDDPGKETKELLSEIFLHLRAINDARDDLTHYSSFLTSDKGRVVSNITRAHVLRTLKERQVDIKTINAMSADLRKIGTHLSLIPALPRASRAEREKEVPAAAVPWQYKLPSQPAAGKGKGQDTRQK